MELTMLRRAKPLVLMLGILLVPSALIAQQSMTPNSDGSNSTLSALEGSHAQPATNASSGVVTAVPEDFPDLRLSSGILLGVIVYDEPELTTNVRVDEKGDISLPLIGSIHVGGETVAAARASIQEKYRTGQILKDPQVTLNVLQYVSTQVTVLGAVQAPGRITMLEPHSLLDVIGMAGGETNFAGDTIQVETPASQGHAVRSYHYIRGEDEDALRNAQINPGDTVRVKRAGIVYVLGAVYRPGGYLMQENGSLNVAQAVSLAQGTLLQAKIGAMRVVRREPDGTLKEIPVSYRKIMNGKEEPLELQPQDIVYVPVSKVKSIFTGGATIVGETSSAAIYAVK